jgi:hypothetical protein
MPAFDYHKSACGTFVRFSGTACAFGAVGGSCKESLAGKAFSLAPYTPPLAKEASRGYCP